MKLKRMMAIVLCFAMVLSTMSFSVFAVDATVTNETELTAALAAGGTVTLGNDIEVASQIEIPNGVEVTLDLAGYDIIAGLNGDSTTNHIYVLSNRGTLTVKDATEEGKIVSRGIYNYGTLILDSGTIEACDGNGGYAVNNENGSTFTMNGGAVVTTYDDDTTTFDTSDATAIDVCVGNTTTLNGGKISCVSNWCYAVSVDGTLVVPEDSTVSVTGVHGAVSTNSSGTTTIGGGTFVCEGATNASSDHVLYVSGNGSLTVNGGTFTNNNTDTGSNGVAVCADGDGTQVEINNGTFTGCEAVIYGNVNTVVNGGSYELHWDDIHDIKDSLAQYVAEGATVVVEGTEMTKTESGLEEDTSATETVVATVNGVGYDTLAEALADVGAGDVVIDLLADAELSYGAREAYGQDDTTSITINGNNKTLTLNQTDSDWSSIGMKNADGVFKMNNVTVEKTGYGDTSGAWNTHAINFNVNTEFEDVTFNNAIKVSGTSVLTNVNVVEANGYYGIWIPANATSVTINGGSITATNGGRGIKIADQYVEDSAQKVSLTVDGMTFETAKKAAVLVSSTAGADITATNYDITKVAADSTNFAWVDEEWSSSADKVTVNGASVFVEGTVAKIGDECFSSLDAALDYAKTKGMTEVEVAVLDDVAYTSKIAQFEKVTFTGTDRNQTFDLNVNSALDINTELVFNDLTVSRLDSNWLYHYTYIRGGLTYNDCKMVGLFNVTAQDTDFIECDFYNDDTFGDGSYSIWLYNCYDNIDVNITDCTFDVYERAIKMYGDGYTGAMTLDISGTEFVSRTADKTVVEMAYDNTTGTGSMSLNIDDSTASGFGAPEHISGEANAWFNVENTNTTKNTISIVTIDGVVVYSDAVAKIGEDFYMDLADAFAAANAGDTVTLLKDVTGNVTVNKAITIDGNNKTIAGKLSVTADSATVKNATVNNGSSTAGYINAKNVLIENCTVTGGNGFRYCYTTGTVTFRNSTITGSVYGIHFDGSAGGNIVIDNCIITGWTSFAGTITKVTIADSEFAEGNYNQLRFYQDSEITGTEFNEDMTIDFGKNGVECVIKNCNVSDGSPITDVIYLADLATMGVQVIVDDEALVVEAGVTTGGDTTYFTTLTEALKNVKENSVLTLYADITVSALWDCRNNGAKITVPVTIDGNGHTLKLTGSVKDNNWNTVFRFEKDATVKNLTIDASGASDIQRGISAKYNITVDNCKLIGNGTSAKRGIIFGEGAGSELPNVTATITASTFEGWSYGVSDNQSGKDAKSVSVTDSKFINASVLVSAAETVTFTGNTVTDGYVNISSYTAADTVLVTATGNTLVGEFDIIQTNPDNITADEEFITPVAKIGSKYYETLSKAISKAADGDTIVLLKTVVIDEDMTLDLNGYTVMGNIVVEAGATVEIKNGKIINNNENVSAIQSYGTTTLTDLDVTSARHAVRVEGGITTINSGDYKVAPISKKTLHAVNVSGGGQVVINGGNFTGPKGTVADSGAAVNIQANSKGTINGGTFKGGKNNTLSAKGILTVHGGVFDQDPTSYVATGYVATPNADKTLYVVTAERTLRLEPSATEVKTGNTFTVDVYIDTANVWEVEWVLEYDETLFEIVDMTTSYTNWGDDKEPAIYATNSAIDETKPVATYTFKKNVKASTQSEFTFKFAEISILTDYESVNNITVPCNDAEFSIKINLDYVVEVGTSKYDYYITGKKLVLVYTNATGITFDYDGIQMYEVTGAGYEYEGEDEEEFTQTADTKVYALVVDAINNGVFEDYEVKVSPDHVETATVITYDKEYTFDNKLFDNDVSGDSYVKPNDITNVYLVAVCNEIALGEMDIMLKADVDGDKQVNMFDAKSIINELYRK